MDAPRAGPGPVGRSPEARHWGEALSPASRPLVSVVAAQDQDLLSPCSGSSYTEQSRRWTASRQGAWLFAARPPEGVHAGQSAKPAAIAWTQALGGASSRYRGRPRPLRGHCWHPSGSGVISSVRRQPAMALPGRKHIGRAAKDLLEAQVMAAYDVQYGANNPGIGDGGENSPFSGTPQQDVRNELQNMLERFEGDMNKVLYAKRKRFKMNTDASVNTMQQTIAHAWKTHQEQRQKLCLEYSQRLRALIRELDLAMKKLKEEEEKLASILLQLQKACEYSRIVQSRRMRQFKVLHVEFLKDAATGAILEAESSPCQTTKPASAFILYLRASRTVRK
ncbi:synaptonemal complex protein 3-like [Microcebus murinus]|uniref:synaptonemal complex protein 3-like n=1 Tax=Microcebus murinus TaxID=30608 RepID=UPI003F6AAA18